MHTPRDIPPPPTATLNRAVSRPASKKSHACGPCRRLKRKCDLRIPCGTCQKGRNIKIEECLANPAKPLSNIQELVAPNPKFGRIQKASPPQSRSYQNKTTSPRVPQDGQTSTNMRNQNFQHTSPLADANGPYGHFNVNEKANFGSVSSLSSKTSPHGYEQQQQQQQHLQVSQSQPHQHPQQQPPNQLHPHDPLTQLSSASQQVPLQNMYQYASSSMSIPPPPPPMIPGPPPRNLSSTDYFYNSDQSQVVPPNYQAPQQQHHQNQGPMQQILQHASPQQPQEQTQIRIGAIDQNSEVGYLKKKLDESLRVIQSLENENALHKNQVDLLQAEASRRTTQESFSSSITDHSSSNSYKNQYKFKYIKLLPSKIQTKILVDFYLQNLDYIYHPLHHPSFKRELENFWQDPEKADIGWLAVLFVVLCLAAIHLPKGLINIESAEIERSHKIWFAASKECISISDSLRKDPSEFNLLTLQVFSLYQLYFYATKRAEQLNDFLQKAVKDAHDMGLDKDDIENPNLLEVEMKRRLWWDICGCDTFRSLSLGCKPLIRSYHSTVPFPSNCNDDDMTPDSVKIKSPNVPTDNSFNIHRAHMMKILNGIYEKEHHKKSKKSYPQLDQIDNPTFRGLLEIDIELCESAKYWYFQLDKECNIPYVNDIRIQFQHHMLHTCICIHRFRIYQNYLSEGIPIAWEVGKTAAKSLFHVYRKLRQVYDLKNPLFLTQIHQAFTGSIIQSMLLLLNHKLGASDRNALYQDIDLMLNDLDTLSKEVFILKPEVLKESFKVLNHLRKSFNKHMVELKKDQKDIVSNVFGGRDMTENYLKKCTVSFIIDRIDPNMQANQDEQEQLEQEQGAYDYVNQLGSVVTNELVGESVKKFREIEQSKKKEVVEKEQPTESDGIQDLFRNTTVPEHAANPEERPRSDVPTATTLNNGVIYNNHNSNDTSGDEPRKGSDQSVTHLPNGNVEDGDNHMGYNNRMARQSTPLEFTLNDAEGLWTDMGQQGIDELNNMYYSEFSGYKII